MSGRLLRQFARASWVMRVSLIGVGALATQLVYGDAHADTLPPFTAMDLVAKPHRSTDFVGKITMVVAMTDRGAGDGMSAWWSAANSHFDATVARKSIISLHMPFFITTAYARDQARAQVPERYWGDTLLDRGDMAQALGLAESKIPYVFALDERGKIVAQVHALVQSPEANKIWQALSR
jgi:hypothetical protein